MTVHFLSKGPLDQVSGGYLYNRYLIEYLRAAGIDVVYHPDADGLDDARAADTLVVDSIVADDVWPRLLTFPAELVLLLHVVPESAYDGRADAFAALCRRSRVVVTGTEALAQLRRLVPEAAGAVTIEPGVPEEWPRKTDYARRARNLLAVTNYVHGKGIAQMLAVLKRLEHLPWTLTLHGNRELDPACYAAARCEVEALDLADRVDLLGPVPHADVNEKMRRADLLVHFSHHETYSIVTAEAIACGLPVVSYRTGNHEAFSGSGLVRYLERDGAPEAEALRALMVDEEAYGRLRRGGAWQARGCADMGADFLAFLGAG